ncbi:MAG: beta-ketoacyl-ACP synthase II [Desulfovibrionaceae bacterium]
MHRVVVTGMSVVSPLGNSLEESWKNVLACKSGIAPITAFDATDFSTRIAGELKNFDPTLFGFDPKALRRMDRFSQMACVAAKMLMEDANYQVTKENEKRLGVLLGTGVGGISTIEIHARDLISKGPNKISPFMIPMFISNMAPGHVAITVGAKGVNLTITSACASATHAIGLALDALRVGRADAIITGGVEASITPLGISGFTALKALSSYNDEPTKASRPFDAQRDGFVMGEGAGFLLLETLESAQKRGATIYAEIVGAGASDDAYHITAPLDTGEGMIAAMKHALDDAKIAPEAIDYINAHGTSTPLNDMCETRSIKEVFGKHAYKLAVSSNKSQVGHLLGAAGGIELAFTIKGMCDGIIPGTMNLEHPDPECDLDYIPNEVRKMQIEYAISNSFGFGGTNGCIVVKRFQ